MMSKSATITTSHGKPPVVSAGVITPELCEDFKNDCLHYFNKKSIPADKQVAKIIHCFQGIVERTWLNNNRDHLIALSFQGLETKLRGYRQNGVDFRQWANDFYSKALLLAKTSRAMTEEKIINDITMLSNDHLRARAEKTEFAKIKKVNNFINAIAAEDRLIREVATLPPLPPPPPPPPQASLDPVVLDLPALTDAEKRLLFDNDGCFKCRRPFVGHQTAACPNNFLTKENVVLIMQAYINSVNPNKKRPRAATVAAITHGFIEAVNSDEDVRSIAATLTEDLVDDNFQWPEQAMPQVPAFNGWEALYDLGLLFAGNLEGPAATDTITSALSKKIADVNSLYFIIGGWEDPINKMVEAAEHQARMATLMNERAEKEKQKRDLKPKLKAIEPDTFSGNPTTSSPY
ncbi:hypothetical protein BKA70DRAFT_1436266 [Coprinopsis sp. MPI-PUGE-AT-0042]|nr:hypothetical protein BKA70DRAFT_1436266 [Coprinopsis sp. MPI-PUGE-AT-0042]